MEKTPKFGMSDRAREPLLILAQIRCGTQFIEYSTSGGVLGITRGSCRNRQPSGQARDDFDNQAPVREACAEEQLLRLQPLADADESGFVTTSEAYDLRLLLQAGADTSNAISLNAKIGVPLELFFRTSPDQLGTRIQQYNEVVRSIPDYADYGFSAIDLNKLERWVDRATGTENFK